MTRRACVYCGGQPGREAYFVEAARALGAQLARRGIGLVYGGASVGCMGAVADAAREHGGEVIGVIPRQLVERELAHRGLTELRVVETMHERKALMASLSSGFIALPGGFGTLDELFEMLTWAQLGLHARPIVVVDLRGFYDALLRFVDHAEHTGFLRPGHRDLLIGVPDVTSALDALEAHPGFTAPAPLTGVRS
jgi:uncharacterized protein (TIGR00730 family)